MTSIIIYTKKEKLKHKKNLRNACSFWTFPYYPKKFDEDEDNVLFAYDGFIQGYFDNDFSVVYRNKIPKGAVRFSPRWNKLEKPIPIKHFQGFKYTDEFMEHSLKIERERRFGSQKV